MSRISITRITGTELHHRYARESRPQNCYVELDCRTGALGAEYDPEIGTAVPFDVHHGHRIRWTIPALRADAANALLDEIAPRAARIVAGYSSEWDGSDHVARLDADAQRACEEIDATCDEHGGPDTELAVWEASDWFAPLGSRAAQARELGITAATTDEELYAIAAWEEATAEGAEDCDGLDGCGQYLLSLRDHMRDVAAEAAE